MKRVLLIFGTSLFIFFGCASTQVSKKDSLSVSKPFDVVWAASVQSISDMGFAIKSSDKAGGIISAEGGRNLIIHNEAPRLNVYIRKINDQVSIDCQATQPGQIVDYGSSSHNVKEFFDALQKNL